MDQGILRDEELRFGVESEYMVVIFFRNLYFRLEALSTCNSTTPESEAVVDIKEKGKF